MRLSILSKYVPFLVAKREAPAKPEASALQRVLEQLSSLNLSTEQDFLTIGARLMEFLTVADGIATRVSAVIHSTAGEQGKRAAVVLEHALDRCRRLVAISTEDRTHLDRLRADAVQVARIFGGFRQAVASFHVVCTMTRIEAARLGAAGAELGPLTDEVLALAHRMEAQVERVLTAATAIDRHVEEIAAGLRGTNDLLDHLSLTIPQVLRNLDAFSAQQTAASALSAQLADDSRSVANAIMDAVTSIQFHDITRQQIEHVIAALEHLSTHPRNLAAAVQLEAMQLASANETFAHSVTRLWHDLESIAASVHGMSAHGHTLLSGCGNDSAFFLEMQHCLDAIAAAVASHRSAQTTTKQAAHALSTTLESMQSAAAEIRELDVRLLRVALNTNLRAAHLGPAGDTLAVLASALQDLATRAQQRSHQAIHALDSMDSALTLLVAHPAEDDDATLKQSIPTTMHALRQAGEDGTRQLAGIAASATHLAEGIALAREGFHAGRLFAETVPLCLTQLHAIAALATPYEAPSDTLEAFARRYTMQSERDIHAAAGERIQPVLVAAGDTSLGDNIELF